MSIHFLSSIEPADQPALAELDCKLANFYNSDKVHNYWEKADDLNYKWEPHMYPYHLHLKSFIKPGDKVVELGCGSAHAFLNLQSLQIHL